MSFPELGTVVHYVERNPDCGGHTCRPALVTAVGGWVLEESRELPDSTDRRRVLVERWDPNAIAACVMTPSGTFAHESLARDPGHLSVDPRDPVLCTGLLHRFGTWHWPGGSR